LWRNAVCFFDAGRLARCRARLLKRVLGRSLQIDPKFGYVSFSDLMSAKLRIEIHDGDDYPWLPFADCRIVDANPLLDQLRARCSWLVLLAFSQPELLLLPACDQIWLFTDGLRRPSCSVAIVSRRCHCRRKLVFRLIISLWRGC